MSTSKPFYLIWSQGEIIRVPLKTKKQSLKKILLCCPYNSQKFLWKIKTKIATKAILVEDRQKCFRTNLDLVKQDFFFSFVNLFNGT